MTLPRHEHRLKKCPAHTKAYIALVGILLFLSFPSAFKVRAQEGLPIYTDHLVNGFQNWSWATVNLTNTTPVHFGAHSVSVIDSTNYQAVYFEHPAFDTTPYAAVDFWINGGSDGGQSLQAGGVLNGSIQLTYPLETLAPNHWQHITIPLSSLGIADATNFTGFWIQGSVNTAQPPFYLDDVQLTPAPAPATVHLEADASSVIRAADPCWFGMNVAVWDDDFSTSATSNALREIGCTTLRFPGGSLSDIYDWRTRIAGSNDFLSPVSFEDFMTMATNLAAQAFITVNYGTGTPSEAAAWVACANITNHCHFQYWEIGNEVYGPWEADSNAAPHNPEAYATRAAEYIRQMKAVDPAIKIGAVAVTGEDAYTNLTTAPAINPVTGVIHYGWTPVMLATFRKLGVLPDFLIYHYYPQYTAKGPDSSDSDALLLQSSANWARDAEDLRKQISDYLGPAGTNIELCVTENNSDSGAQGKQSTSIVDALYLADNLGQLMKTEFNSYIWWDLRNGPGTEGDFDSSLYGWRRRGDLGILSGLHARYPTFYAEKLLKDFVRPGDFVLDASSDYLLLSDYAVRRKSGALTLLVINKDLGIRITAQIALRDFTPASTAIVRSYGIPQDEATRTNGPASLRDIATTTISPAGPAFLYSFPPASLTLFTFSPDKSTIRSSANLQHIGRFVWRH